MEKPGPLKDGVAQDEARLLQEQAQASKDDATLLHQKRDKRQQELAEDSDSSSTGGNKKKRTLVAHQKIMYLWQLILATIQ